MNSKLRIWRSRITTYALAGFVLFITITIIRYPKETFEAAILGLNLWWNIVFPSLLPFFILSELLMGLGIVHALGVLLEPLMRPIFNTPGIGAFALSMGLASGYPMDAVITCNFRKSKLCSQVEAERLLAFTNTADPLFMFGAVAVGMFGAPEVGVTLAIAHYMSSMLVGIIFRFYGRSRDDKKAVNAKITLSPRRVLGEMYKARAQDGRSFGVLLGDSVKASMNTIILIGGFIIFFSVFLHILSGTVVSDIISFGFARALTMLNFSPDLAMALHDGLFEIDIGAMTASKSTAPLVEKITIVSAIIAWSGLSVHGQVASIISEANINVKPYIVARLIHAVLAGGLAYIFFTHNTFAADIFSLPVSTGDGGILAGFFTLTRFQQSCIIMTAIISTLIIFSLLLHFCKSICNTRPRRRNA